MGALLSRVLPPSPMGSLFKQGKRVVERDYLGYVRDCPCLSCSQDPAGEAAHVRLSAAYLGKPTTGTGVKPDDCWTVPLCHQCHMKQHATGETPFWDALGLNPLAIAMALYKSRDDLKIMRDIIFSQREIRK